MKVIHFNTTDRGGAARAGLRLHEGLLHSGIDSTYAVKHQYSEIPGVIEVPSNQRQSSYRTWLDRQIRWQRKKRSAKAIEARLVISECRTSHRPEDFELLGIPDIYQLHWIANYIDWSTTLPWLTQRAPIVWRLPDMNAFSGIFHYEPDDLLLNPCLRHWDSKVRKIKREALASINPEKLIIVGPSRWIAGQAQKSEALGRFRTEVIPNALNVKKYTQMNQEEARRQLGIDPDTKVIDLAADDLADPRKGIQPAIRAIQQGKRKDSLLLTIGSHTTDDSLATRQMNLGYLRSDTELSQFYSALDLFLMPSLQESFGQTCLESLACGTPVIAFNSGGIPDMVRPGQTGWLVPTGDFNAMSDTIDKALKNSSTLNSMRTTCRRVAETEFNLETQSAAYTKIYESLTP